MVKRLLEWNGINPNLADTQSGQTALLWTAENHHENVVRMVQEQNNLNPNVADIQDGQRPVFAMG